MSPWAPLAPLVTDRGQRYAMLAAVFYAPPVIVIKQANLASNAPTGTLGGYFVASLMTTPIALRTSATHFAAVPRHWRDFVALGLFAALTTISQGQAYAMTLSSYVEAVKQVEIPFAMAIGIAAFGDTQVILRGATSARPTVTAKIYEAWAAGRFTLLLSEPILEEIEDVVSRPEVLRRLRMTTVEAGALIERLRRHSVFVTPTVRIASRRGRAARSPAGRSGSGRGRTSPNATMPIAIANRISTCFTASTKRPTSQSPW